MEALLTVSAVSERGSRKRIIAFSVLDTMGHSGKGTSLTVQHAAYRTFGHNRHIYNHARLRWHVVSAGHWSGSTYVQRFFEHLIADGGWSTWKTNARRMQDECKGPPNHGPRASTLYRSS
jgi:hypothetical protein